MIYSQDFNLPDDVGEEPIWGDIETWFETSKDCHIECVSCDGVLPKDMTDELAQLLYPEGSAAFGTPPLTGTLS